MACASYCSGNASSHPKRCFLLLPLQAQQAIAVLKCVVRGLLQTAQDSGAADAAGALPATLEASWVAATAAGGPAGLAALAAALPSVASLAASLAELWRQPAQQAAAQLELAQLTATLSCSNLRCANLEGGGVKGGRCSGCMAVRYCSKACALASWRAGHKQACKALAAARQQLQEQPST